MTGTCSVGRRVAVAAAELTEAYCSLENLKKFEMVRAHARCGIRGPSLRRRRQWLAAWAILPVMLKKSMEPFRINWRAIVLTCSIGAAARLASTRYPQKSASGFRDLNLVVSLKKYNMGPDQPVAASLPSLLLAPTQPWPP